MNSSVLKQLLAAASTATAMLCVPAAQSADLAGNCCADLEERITELEASVARKGNRLVTLSITGQVSRALLYWRDAGSSDLYSLGNSNQNTRFRFAGEGKLTEDLRAGYTLEIDIFDSTTSFASQKRSDASGNLMRMRQDFWWLESKVWGRITVGHTGSAAYGTDTIDLGELSVATSAHVYLHSGGLFLVNKNTKTLIGSLWGNVLSGTTGGALALTDGGAIDPSRGDLIKYDSPSVYGFQLSTAWGENDAWDIALRFVHEWNGLRFAAGIGYIEDTNEDIEVAGQGGILQRPLGTTSFAHGRRDIHQIQGSASLWHVPSGVFLSGTFYHREHKGLFDVDAQGTFISGPRLIRPDADAYWVAGGLRRNWLGIGTTAFYGEYFRSLDLVTGSPAQPFTGLTASRISDSSAWFWGLGLVQNIDAAGSEFFISYRHQHADIFTQTAINGPQTKQPVSDLDVVLSGIRVKF